MIQNNEVGIFSDKGFNGNVILPQFDQIETKNESEIIVGSGVFLPKLSRFFKANMIANGEFLIGIPGTVGGAVKKGVKAFNKADRAVTKATIGEIII